ncbi:hypothetical protein OAO01_07780 [Oligoflexia bacterium]|nr:hypothetical protein [Oligoflexia bacterium]
MDEINFKQHTGPPEPGLVESLGLFRRQPKSWSYVAKTAWGTQTASAVVYEKLMGKDVRLEYGACVTRTP